MRYLNRHWQTNTPLSLALRPAAWLFRLMAGARRVAYRVGLLRQVQLSVPVLIVGNISVGGTGKTPLVIALARVLRDAGWQPGIITRGYGGRGMQWPVRVTAEADPLQVGDEAVLLARHAGVPVAAAPDRVAAAHLLMAAGCDLIVSDDGLQHYRLARDVEIAVIDGERGLGNGACLPAGPLREPPARLAQVDLVLTNGASDDVPGFTLVPTAFVNLADGRRVDAGHFVGHTIAAVAGIGNPERFFHTLEHQGLVPRRYAFPDHYPFAPASLRFLGDSTVIMTEKDAVKCAAFAASNWWYLAVEARMPPALLQRIVDIVQEKSRG